jgi:hypothetical protein
MAPVSVPGLFSAFSVAVSPLRLTRLLEPGHLSAQMLALLPHEIALGLDSKRSEI